MFLTNRLMHATTAPVGTVHNAPPLSTAYLPPSAGVVHIDKPLFTVTLPAGWKSTPVTAHVNIPNYSFKSSSPQLQQLDIFIDNIPSTMAVNRVVTVTPKAGGMDHETVSDNCTTFTTAVNVATGVVAGKWGGASFLCDEGNYQRDVVGTVSNDGINYVTLTGPTVGSHKVFLTYTDNSINPDFSSLYTILESFKLK